MNRKIVLNPHYSGPGMIDEYLRKVKSQSSLGRMISNFNRRYFILDLGTLSFYYLPEKGSHFTSSSDIPLDTITRIYIDKQLQMLDDEHGWKYGFVVVTKKRVYRVISQSQATMDKFLFGFANLMNSETGKPLFDWNAYKIEEMKNMAAPQLIKYNNQASDEQKAPLQVENNSIQKQEVSNLEQPKRELSPKSPKRHLGDKEYIQAKEVNFSKNKVALEKKEEVNEDNTKDNRDESVGGLHAGNPRENFMYRGNTYGKTTVDNESERLRYSNIRMTSIDENGNAENKVDVRPNEDNSRSNQKSEVSKAKVEVLDVEEPERNGRENSREPKRSSSVRRDSGLRRNSSGLNAAKKNDNDFGFVGFNHVDLNQYQKKKSSSNFWNDDAQEKQTPTPASGAGRERMRPTAERKMNLGNGIQVSFPKFEEGHEKQDLPASYLNMMQEAKKFSPLVQNERGKVELKHPKSGNTVNEAKNNQNEDDDWDKEMFGEDFEKIGKSIGKVTNKDKDNSSQNLTGLQESKLNNTRKQLCHKKSEILASREEAYNDWDDEL